MSKTGGQGQGSVTDIGGSLNIRSLRKKKRDPFGISLQDREHKLTFKIAAAFRGSLAALRQEQLDYVAMTGPRGPVKGCSTIQVSGMDVCSSIQQEFCYCRMALGTSKGQSCTSCIG